MGFPEVLVREAAPEILLYTGSMKPVMLVVSVPVEHAETLRTALAEAGAGSMGKYSGCSFSYRGTGRFIPGEGSNPAYGTIGEVSSVEEERIEMLCESEAMPRIISALREVHPYEEPASHYFPVQLQ